MKTFQKTEELPINEDYDLIVCGSGPAGVTAAIAAGRQGIKTLLIEMLGDVGGISTSGLMSHFTGRCGNKLYQETLDKMWQNAQFTPNRREEIDPEILKNVYYDMLNEAHVDILLYTMICDVVMDGNSLTGVIVQNKTGRSVYKAKVFIDGTGDGDVAYKAGAEYVLGREEDHKMQPATLMFKVAGVNMETAVFPGGFESLIDTEKGELQSLGKSHLPAPAGHVLLYKSPIPGIVTCNMTNVLDIDGTKAEDLTKAEVICRSQMLPIVKFLREFAPGYENCYIISAASLIGIRETRHFKGLQTINEKEILEAKQFDDAVVYDAWFNFDVHNITGSGLDKTGCQKHYTQKLGYTIPYGCLVPEKIENLLLSGRNISGTHMAHSNFRAMPICSGIGEACGYAASIAIKKGILLRDVNPKDIQSLL